MTPEQKAQKDREEAFKRKAAQDQRAITYTDTDGCEITVLPSGHVLYNATDWW